MKLYILFFIFISILALPSCDPDNNQLETYHATLKGRFNNTNETITLGDTLKFSLQWPDTLITETPLGDARTETVKSLQRAWYTFSIARFDTINRKVYMNDSTKVSYIINPGFQITPCPTCYTGATWFQTQTKPYSSGINIIPQAKGIYYLEIHKQPSPFKVNKKFEGLFSVTLDVPDKHLRLVDQYIPGFESAIIEAGMSFYCFRVN